MMVSRTWAQVAALVVLFGFTVLGFLAFRTYETGPPIADRVVSQDGKVLFTGADVTAGQELFLKDGLMEYGSVFGHGAYLGPDFTADYLHRAAVIATRQYGGSASDTAAQRVIKDFKTNRYDATTRTLTYTNAQATAFEEMVSYYANYFGPTSHDKGLVTNAISDRTQIRQLTSFFAWSAWSGSTLRPDKNYSYTNSWPPETLVGNSPPANVLVWSVLSLIALLAGIGALFAAFGRWATVSAGRAARPSRSPSDHQAAWYSPRHSAPAPTTSSSWACSSSSRPWSVPPVSTTVSTSPASSGSTSPAGCPTTWCAPGTSSCRSSGPRRHSWPPESSSPP